MKKRIYYFMAVLFTASVCLGFTSCDDEDGDGDGPISTDGKITGKLQLVEEDYDEETNEYYYELIGAVTDEIDELVFNLDDYDEDDYYSDDHYVLGKCNVIWAVELYDGSWNSSSLRSSEAKKTHAFGIFRK